MAHPYVYVRSPDLFAELIDIADVTRAQLARRARCSRAHITLVSQGKRGCNPRVAWRIANTLGATVDELFTQSRGGERCEEADLSGRIPAQRIACQHSDH